MSLQTKQKKKKKNVQDTYSVQGIESGTVQYNDVEDYYNF